MKDCRRVSLARLFHVLDDRLRVTAEQSVVRPRAVTALQKHLSSYAKVQGMDGLKRMDNCRRALEALDRRGWQRSFHQRLFHEEYLKSCARIFFKRDGPGAFARSHTRLLEANGWDSTPQVPLIATHVCLWPA